MSTTLELLIAENYLRKITNETNVRLNSSFMARTLQYSVLRLHPPRMV